MYRMVDDEKLKTSKLRFWDPHPRPPIRARSPYMFFVAEYYRRYQRHLNTRNPQEIIRTLIRHWREMEGEGRIVYIAKSQDDRIRFIREFNEWRGMFQEGRIPHCRRKKKDPSKPKQPKNAYVYFLKELLPKLRENNPNLHHRQLISALGQSWRRMTSKEKQPYQLMSQQDKDRFRMEKREFKTEKKKSKLEGVQSRRIASLEALRCRRMQDKLGVKVVPNAVAVVVEKQREKETVPNAKF